MATQTMDYDGVRVTITVTRVPWDNGEPEADLEDGIGRIDETLLRRREVGPLTGEIVADVQRLARLDGIDATLTVARSE